MSCYDAGMRYRTVFDLAQIGFKVENFSFLLPGFVLVGLGIGLVIYRKYLTDPMRRRPMPASFPTVFLAFGILWTLISIASLYSQYHEAYSALQENRISIIEGKVAEFDHVFYGGHMMEQFCVTESDVCFRYSDYVVTPGFNRTNSYGGPIREHLPVRITYLNNMILRLEIGE